MQRLFETNTNQATDVLPDSVDTSIVFTGTPYIMYKQLKLDDNFRRYLLGTLISEHVLRTGIKSIQYQTSFELVAGTESRVVNFQGTNKKFSFLLVLLVYDKSDEDRSIYDSYNTELASTKIKLVKLENVSNTYSSFNSLKFDNADAHGKYLLYSQIIVWYCKGSRLAPLSDYAHNPIYQELPTMSKYFASAESLLIKFLEKGYTNEIEK